MKKYLAIGLIGILFLSACAKSENTVANPAPLQEETVNEAPETAAPKTEGSVQAPQSNIFREAVDERNLTKCNQIKDTAQKENCISIVTRLKTQEANR